MGRLSERLKTTDNQGRCLYLIYHLEAHLTYLPLTQEIFTGIEAGQWSTASSVIPLMELTIHP